MKVTRRTNSHEATQTDAYTNTHEAIQAAHRANSREAIQTAASTTVHEDMQVARHTNSYEAIPTAASAPPGQTAPRTNIYTAIQATPCENTHKDVFKRDPVQTPMKLAK